MRTVMWLAVLAAVSLQARSSEPLTFVRAIGLPQVEGRIDHLALNASGSTLFMAALGNNTVEVMDVENGSRIKSQPGFHEPQGIAFALDANVVAVANGEGEGVHLLDAKDYHVATNVTLGADSDNVRYDPTAKRLYVGYGGGALAAIDPASGAVIGQVKLAGHPESFQLEQAGSRIFVNVPSAGQVAVVDRNAMRIAATWPVSTAKANYPMALDEKQRRLFIGCRHPAKVLVYDLAAGQQLAAFDIVGDTDDMFVDAERQRLYVIGGEGFIDVFDVRQRTAFPRLARIATADGARTGLFGAAQGRLYLAVPHRGSQGAEVRIYQAHD